MSRVPRWRQQQIHDEAVAREQRATERLGVLMGFSHDEEQDMSSGRVLEFGRPADEETEPAIAADDDDLAIPADDEPAVDADPAPPVAAPVIAPPLRGSTTVTTWKARLSGTSGADDPNPEMPQLNDQQRLAVFSLMRAVLEGKAPLTFFTLNWSAINGRARAEKNAFSVVGLEVFEEGTIRSKSTRVR